MEKPKKMFTFDVSKTYMVEAYTIDEAWMNLTEDDLQDSQVVGTHEEWILEDGWVDCANCESVVRETKIYSTHEDNDDPNNLEYCEECQFDFCMKS